MKRIIAKTILFANSGNKYHYSIQFTLDEESGKIRFISEKGKLFVRPYLLLKLVAEVIRDTPLAKKQCSKVSFVMNDGSNCRHPAFEVDGKRYRLNKEVEGKWILNPHVISMASHMLEKGDEYEKLSNYDYAFHYCVPEPMIWEYIIL